jgi:hypothetical protein
MLHGHDHSILLHLLGLLPGPHEEEVDRLPSSGRRRRMGGVETQPSCDAGDADQGAFGVPEVTDDKTTR